jgi:hypothetical protein
MMKDLKFVCPNCGGDRLEERSTGDVFHGILAVRMETDMPEEPEIEWGSCDAESVVVRDYRCFKCEKVISDGPSTEDLRDALLKLPCNKEVNDIVESHAMEYPDGRKECGACGELMDDSDLLHSEDGFDYCRQCVADGGGRSKFGIVDDREIDKEGK